VPNVVEVINGVRSVVYWRRLTECAQNQLMYQFLAIANLYHAVSTHTPIWDRCCSQAHHRPAIPLHPAHGGQVEIRAVCHGCPSLNFSVYNQIVLILGRLEHCFVTIHRPSVVRCI